MLVLTGSGRERTAAKFTRRFARAGLRIARTLPLPSLFGVYELVPARPGATRAGRS